RRQPPRRRRDPPRRRHPFHLPDGHRGRDDGRRLHSSRERAVRLYLLGGVSLLVCATATHASAAELPADYFKLLAVQVKAVEGRTPQTANPGAMLAAAVLYTKQHPANPSAGDRKLLNLALQLGDLSAAASGKDTAENKQDYEWEIHFWIDTFRLLEPQLTPGRHARW